MPACFFHSQLSYRAAFLFCAKLYSAQTAAHSEAHHEKAERTSCCFCGRHAGYFHEAATWLKDASCHGPGGKALAEQILQQDVEMENIRKRREAMRSRLATASSSAEMTTVLLSGWLHKESFNLTKAENSWASRIGGWKKRWFTLSSNGMLCYYKNENDTACALPIDLRQVTSVVDPDLDGAGSEHHHSEKSKHFHFMFGGRECGLKADTVEDKMAWVKAMHDWLDSHAQEQATFLAAQEAKYAVKGTGVRDLDRQTSSASTAAEHLLTKSGFLYRHENGKSWRGKKKWVEVVLADSTITFFDEVDGKDGDVAWHPTQKMPLMLATVKEERDTSLRFCFRIITPSESNLFQAGSKVEMQEVRNAAVKLLL
eukprot:SAG31_NODE_4_length_45662_cov_15.654622_24_plen_370_part_00